MEKEKKITKSASTAKKQVKTEPKKDVKTNKPAKATVKEKIEKVQPVIEEKVVKSTPVVSEAKVEKEQPIKMTLNQDLNLLIGLFSLITIISFCFAFQGGDTEVLGWELFLKGGEYSGVFKGLMILYVVSLFIDCILTIRIDSENEIFNIVEKALYMITLIMNFIVVAVLLSIISKIGIGLIIFFIISIVSVLVKFARIFAQK